MLNMLLGHHQLFQLLYIISLHAKQIEPFLAESIYALSRPEPGTGNDSEMK